MVKNKWKSGIAVLASAGILSALVAGCGTGSSGNAASSGNGSNNAGSTTASGKPVEGGNITLDVTSTFKDLDPAKAFDMASGELVDAMYDQLVRYKGTSTSVVPMAAQSFSVSPDGKTYTFHIRQGVKFWNGDAMTAQSFANEFKRILNPKVGSPGSTFVMPIIQGSEAYYKGQAKTISGITTPDKYTLVIKLNKPEPFFDKILTMPFFSAIDQKFVNKVGNKAYDTTAMGTGPYELGKVTPGKYVLTKNPHYWRNDTYGQQLPYLNQITIDVTENTQTQALRFENGTTAVLGTLTGGVPGAQYPQFTANPQYKKTLKLIPMVSIWYVDMNVKDKPFNNVQVRRALEYAINKKTIVKLLNGRAEVANQPTPPMLPGYNKNLPASAQYSYNPKKAKEMLAKAGYPNGFKVTLETFNDPTDTKIIESIAQDLNAIGVQCTPKPVSGNIFLTQYLAGKVPFFFTGYNEDFPDASDFLNTEFNSANAPSTNNTWYNNPQVDALLNKAQTDTNQAERVKLYEQLNTLLMQDAAQIPVYIPMNTIAVQPWVHGYVLSQTQFDPLTTLWVDKSHTSK